MEHSQRLAAQVVGQVLEGRNLSQLLDQLWRSHAWLAPQQRAMVQEFSYGTLRHLGQLQALLARLVERPLPDQRVRCLLLVALYQLEHGAAARHAVVDQAVSAAGRLKKPWAKGLVNAVLRNFLRRREQLLQDIATDEVARYSYPQWWIDKLRQQYPSAWQDMLQAGNQRPPMTLRVNLRRTSIEDILHRLEQAGVAARPVGETAIMLAQPMPVDQLPGFAQGELSVQDYGAQHAARLLELRDGQRVLDACCAPGGKTGHILEMADVLLTAVDSDDVRIERTRSNLQRLGLGAELRVGDAGDPSGWWDGQPFERILADVPCSASGIVRRHADIKWLRRESDIAGFAEQQARMLRSLWHVLANGGKLLYATCSVFVEENQCQIDAFLKHQPDARQLPLPGLNEGQLLPCAEHDGFFYALLQRASLLLLLAGLCGVLEALADNILVRQAQLVAVAEGYQLNAKFDIDFPAEVEEALNKGVPIDFLLEFQLVAPRRYWFDDEIVTVSRKIRFSFHALSRQYLVTVDNHQKSFATLDEARDELASVRNWPVLDKNQLAGDENYQASLRLRLDHAGLPQALQIEALGSEKWNLLSERYRWTPAF